jgi:16S rRNA (guanine527-N7)-methyltransferase
MTSKKFSYDDFTKYVGVSRETFARLGDYVELLEKWQKSINLIGTATIHTVWVRHIIDSAQLIRYIDPADKVVDIGSGAGFPGLVIAIMGIKNVTLVESDARKVAFLREAARVTQTEVVIINKRVESIDLKQYYLIIARGFAPLQAMIAMFSHALNVNHKLLLLKGKSYNSEIDAARKQWSFDYEAIPSATDKDGVILSMQNFKKVRTA